MRPIRIQPSDIKHDIYELIDEALNDVTQTGKDIYPQVDQIMQKLTNIVNKTMF